MKIILSVDYKQAPSFLCYNIAMHRFFLIALGLALSAPSALAVETPSQHSQRELRERDAAQREADQAALLARANGGLIIEGFFRDARGWGQVLVHNITDHSVSFDFHQVRGLELDTANTSSGADIKFRADEIASYEVKPGARRNFKVFFFGGRQIAAVQWADHVEWQAGEKTFTDPAELLKAARAAAVVQRKADQKANGQLRGIVVK